MSLPAILDTKKDAVRRYNKLKKRSEELRVDFHKTVAKVRALKYHTAIEVQEKLTHNAFGQKSLFARVKRLAGKPRPPASCQVSVEQEGQPTIQCNTKEIIEAACMDEGRKRYLESSITPMMQEPLLSDFGFLVFGYDSGC
jgi:hypothetical protein